ICNAEPQPEEKSKCLYELFIIQHIIHRMTEDECDNVIENRGILFKEECKEMNTFILSDVKTVKSICKGRTDGDIISESLFEIIDCELKSKTEKKPPCKYNGKRQFKKRIEVSCEGGYPVHYKRALKE
uniref:Ribonuclease A-domain domain-containing protein n=1 Tax=Oreochromis niloticus TaxID=8128 RepID=A0A669CBC6_ORENI